MICIICEQKTDRKFKNIPCCRTCFEKVEPKREEMKAKKKNLADQLSVEGLEDEERKKKLAEFLACPLGTARNALLELEKEKFRVLRNIDEEKGEINV